jgi:hypothetical protein
MSESESVRLARAASVEISPLVAEQVERARAHDDRLGAEQLSAAARDAIAAWVMAVDGDDTTLNAMAEPLVVEVLLRAPWRRYQVSPGPRITSIGIWGLETADEPVRLRLKFRFDGRRWFPAEGDQPGGETTFAGLMDLTLTGPPGQPGQPGAPWRVSAGQTQTLDDYLGYAFTSRPETPEEQQKRVAAQARTGTRQPGRLFRLTSGFAEHDERFGSAATVDVRRETAPTREEAEQLIRPAIWEVTTGALGDGDWNPTMNWLDVIELLDQ